jgi:hypothetical protein
MNGLYSQKTRRSYPGQSRPSRDLAGGCDINVQSLCAIVHTKREGLVRKAETPKRVHLLAESPPSVQRRSIAGRSCSAIGFVTRSCSFYTLAKAPTIPLTPIDLLPLLLLLLRITFFTFGSSNVSRISPRELFPPLERLSTKNARRFFNTNDVRGVELSDVPRNDVFYSPNSTDVQGMS